MAAIAGLQDFRLEGPPGDIGVFQSFASIIVYPFTFSGVTYIVAQRIGVRGWVLATPPNTDASTVIQAAINALTTGGTIYIKAGNYTLTASLTLRTGIRIIGEGPTVTVITYTDATIHTGMFKTGLTGYTVGSLALSVNCVVGDDHAHLVDSSSLSVGDWVKLSSATLFDVGGLTIGEIVKIKTNAANIITFYRRVIDTYNTASNAYVRKLTFLTDITIEGIQFIGQGIETDMTALWVNLIMGLTVKDCIFRDWGLDCFRLIDIVNCYIEDSEFRNIYYTGEGYSIAILNACDNINLSKCSFREYGRHYVVLSSDANAVVSNGGGARNIHISSSHFESCTGGTGECINTHLDVYGPLTVTGSTFQSSLKAMALINCEVSITGNTFRDCGTSAIEIDNNATVNQTRPTTISGNNFFNSGLQISRINVDVSGNFFTGTSRIIITNGAGVLAGVNHVQITGNLFEMCANHNIYILGAAGTEAQHINITVNTFNAPTNAFDAIFASHCKFINVEGNMCYNPGNNFFEGWAAAGRLCDHIKLKYNYIDGNAGYCFQIDGATNVRIIGNDLSNCTARGVSLINATVATTPVIIMFNDLSGTVGTKIFNDGTYTTGIKTIYNDGYNPKGNIATPYSVAAGPLSDAAGVQAFPTTATNYTITYSPKLITIYGGTITSVSIGGVVTGQAGAATFAAYRLEPGQILNVVWTVQPSSVVYAC